MFRFPPFDSHLTWYASFSERDELQKDIEAICLQQSGVAGTVNSYMQARRWVNIHNHIVTNFQTQIRCAKTIKIEGHHNFMIYSVISLRYLNLSTCGVPCLEVGCEFE